MSSRSGAETGRKDEPTSTNLGRDLFSIQLEVDTSYTHFDVIPFPKSETRKNGLVPPFPLSITHTQVTEKLMEAEEKKLRVLKAEIEASKHSDAAGSSDKVLTGHTQCTHIIYICTHSRYLIHHAPLVHTG